MSSLGRERFGVLPACLVAVVLAAACGKPPVELQEGPYVVTQIEIDNVCNLPPFPDGGTGTVEVESRRRRLLIDWEPEVPNVLWSFDWSTDESFDFGLEEVELLRKVLAGCTADVAYLYTGTVLGPTEILVREVLSFENMIGDCPKDCTSTFRYEFRATE